MDPEVVVLSGGITEAGDHVIGPLAGAMDCGEWRPLGASLSIRRAELGARADARGAARAAMD